MDVGKPRAEAQNATEADPKMQNPALMAEAGE
jgi:hypothetical protein